MKTTLLLLMLSISLFAGENEQSTKLLNNVNKNFFIENKGQWPKEVKYLARVGGLNCWITNSGVVYDYFKISVNADKNELMKMTPDKRDDFEKENTTVQGHVVKMNLLDVNENSIKTGNDKKHGYYNYFIGNDKSKWASFVPLYGDIELDEIYSGINVKYYFDGNNIRYDYIVKPGGDLSKIKLRFEGQESLSINDKGELVIKTSLGEVTNGKLYSYQRIEGAKKEVSCSFQKNNDGTISFNTSDYDKQKELIIDPLIYSTYLGGNSEDDGYSIALDLERIAYIAGQAYSTNFPVTPGAYQTVFGGGSDAFITKLNSTGSGLIYSTYVGGDNWDVGLSIALDIQGDAYITGNTHSTNFPITQGTYQTTYGGGIYGDAFITKLNSTGSALVYSTYFGGSGDDWGNSIALDSEDMAYITGTTSSNNFPVTQGAYQITFCGGEYASDAFITKLNSTGSGLLYSTYLGGNYSDIGHSIVLDLAGNAYITGYTDSDNFPVTQGVYQTIGGGDAFVTKLNSTGSGLIYSTYLGGSLTDVGSSIALDSEGNAYITGETASINFPVTQGVYQTTFGYGGFDAFVTKLNSIGSALIYSTYLGGNDLDDGYSITIDSGDNAYITGCTASFNFPITQGAYQTTLGGGQYDAFVTKLNSAGSGIYSTYLGGNGIDWGYSIALDSDGNANITGMTSSNIFPITQGAYQTTFGYGGFDAFVTKLDMTPSVSVKDEKEITPREYKLEQNYPNPFNPSTVIRYSLPSEGNVTLYIYNSLGEAVRQVNLGTKQAGVNEFTFNAAGLSSGVYFYSIKASSSDGKTQQNLFKKMIIIK